jgi:hypothetical protein
MISTYLTVVTGKSITTAKHMSDITVINDSEQSSLVTNGLAKNGELYLKAAGSTDAGAIVVYDSGVWRTFANEYSAGGAWNGNTYSVDFDGTDDFIATGSTFQSTFNSDHSVSLWVKYAGGNQVLAGQQGSTRYYYQISVSQPRIVYYTGTGSIITNIGPTALGSGWTHLVGTLEQDASNIVTKLYINGTLDNTVSTAGTMSDYTSSLDWEIGKRHRPGSSELNFSGKLDEFAIIPSALSASDVTAIYNSGTPDDLTSYSPVAWWRMGDNDGGTGTTITDQGSGGNDGTLTNGPTFSTDIPS